MDLNVASVNGLHKGQVIDYSGLSLSQSCIPVVSAPTAKRKEQFHRLLKSVVFTGTPPSEQHKLDTPQTDIKAHKERLPKTSAI